MGVNHGRMSPQKFGVGDANTNYPTDFQKYRSEFTKTRHFKRKNSFYGEGPSLASTQAFCAP